MIRLSEIRLPLEHAETAIAETAAALLGLKPEAIATLQVFKRSIDARKRDLQRVYIVDVTLRDAALMRNDLRAVPAMIDLARRTRAIILQNVVFALGLKAVFMVLSVSGGASLWMAVLADSGATVLVTLNALRLQRWRMPG